MTTRSTRRRITPDMTPAEKRRAVRALLRELAAVLATARRADRPLPWPPAPPVPPAEPAPTSTAV
jgi:hypothetical protein